MEENKRKQDLEDEMTRFVLLFSFFFCACRSWQIPGNFLLLIKWSENLNLDR